jgi:hypothetical protein
MTTIERPPTNDRLAASFRRLGWIGFWLQIAIGSIPVALLIYAFLFGGGGGISTRGSFALIEYLTIGSLLVLAFTTAWFYRYTFLAPQIAEQAHIFPPSRIQRIAWIGVAASTLGIVFSALVMMFEVAQLLVYFLRAPQGGVPVIQTTGGGTTSWVSAGDILSMMGLIITMLVETVVLSIGLWLLFLTTGHYAKIDTAYDDSTRIETPVESSLSSAGSL